MSRSRRSAALVCLSLLVVRPLLAQCPDGSPPPCRPAIVAIDSNALAVLPFGVAGPPESHYLREGMVLLLDMALDGLAGWRVINPRTTLSRVRPAEDFADVPHAMRTARGLGARSVVVGTVTAAGRRLSIQAQLYDAVRGGLLDQITVEGDIADPAPAIDSLAESLARRRLQSSSGLIRRSLQEYTTNSPRALRLYVAGEEAARRGTWQEAADSLEEAIKTDSTFGLAYFRLYVAHLSGATLHRWDGGYDLIAAGLRFGDRMQPRQRDLLLAVFAQQEGQRQQALRAADNLAARYPHDPEVAYVQGESYFHLGMGTDHPPELALEPFERAIALDPGLPEPYVHAIELRAAAGDTVLAWALLRSARENIPRERILTALEAALRVVFRGESLTSVEGDFRRRHADLDVARVVFELRRILGHDPVRALTVLGPAPVMQGQYNAAGRRIAHTEVPFSSRAAAVLALLTNNADSARATARRIVATQWPDSLRSEQDVDQQLGHLLVGWAAAVRGDSISLDSTLRWMADSGTADYAHGRNRAYAAAHRAGLLGLLALQRFDTTEARRQFAAAYEVRPYEAQNRITVAFETLLTVRLAELEYVAGALRSAELRLEGVESITGTGSAFSADAEELRGKIALQRGDTAAAIKAYRTFVTLWKDADPEFQPRVAAAQAALASWEKQ